MLHITGYIFRFFQLFFKCHYIYYNIYCIYIVYLYCVVTLAIGSTILNIIYNEYYN